MLLEGEKWCHAPNSITITDLDLLCVILCGNCKETFSNWLVLVCFEVRHQECTHRKLREQADVVYLHTHLLLPVWFSHCGSKAGLLLLCKCMLSPLQQLFLMLHADITEPQSLTLTQTATCTIKCMCNKSPYAVRKMQNTERWKMLIKTFYHSLQPLYCFTSDTN